MITKRGTKGSTLTDDELDANWDALAPKITTVEVDTTLNVYAQVMDGSLRRAAETVGSELFTIVHKPETASELTHCVKSRDRGDTEISFLS